MNLDQLALAARRRALYRLRADERVWTRYYLARGTIRALRQGWGA